MRMSARTLLLAGLAAVIGGCASLTVNESQAQAALTPHHKAPPKPTRHKAPPKPKPALIRGQGGANGGDAPIRTRAGAQASAAGATFNASAACTPMGATLHSIVRATTQPGFSRQTVAVRYWVYDRQTGVSWQKPSEWKYFEAPTGYWGFWFDEQYPYKPQYHLLLNYEFLHWNGRNWTNPDPRYSRYTGWLGGYTLYGSGEILPDCWV